MKKRLLPPTIFFSLIFLLTSCGARISDAELISQSFADVGSASFLTNITANFPDREVCFTLDYSYSRDGDDRARVVAPSDIEGIALTVKGESALLEFDGAILEMGRLNENGLSPFSALPSLITSWTDGDFSEAQSTRISGHDATLVISRSTDNGIPLEFRTWFSKDKQTPLYAELFTNGERALQCEFERVEYN